MNSLSSTQPTRCCSRTLLTETVVPDDDDDDDELDELDDDSTERFFLPQPKSVQSSLSDESSSS
jgi:hypothetical protein